jgi:hypothetical protein
MKHLEGSGTPVLYIGRTVLRGYCRWADGIRNGVSGGGDVLEVV